MAGDSIAVVRVGTCGWVRVGAGEGAGTAIVNFRNEAFGEEAVGVGESRGDKVGKGYSNAGEEGVG